MKITDEHRRKISESHKGNKNPMYGKVTSGAFKKGEPVGDKNPNWKGGLPKCVVCGWKLKNRYAKHCIKHRLNTPSGSKHYLWRGGKTPLRKKLERTSDYLQWRDSVFIRDKYTCQICKKVGGMLNADHIKPFAYFPELRLSIDNGRTLCVDCHKKTDTYGGNCVRLYKEEYANINA